VAAHLIRATGLGFGRLAAALLDGEPDGLPSPPRQPSWSALRLHAGLGAGLVAMLVAVWGLTGHGYFWPEWLLLPLALTVAIHGCIELTSSQPRPRSGLALHAGIAASVIAFLVAVWAVTSAGYFWPAWVALAAAIVLAVHWLTVRVGGRDRLARRVEVLESTRAAAVDAQEVELRRIERDLHDGAQARLVALGMSLGMAEQKLATDPEAAQALVSEARAAVGEALHELRDLARGIHPPVLSDRGLGAALDSLALRSVVPVSVSVSLDERLPAAVETAAYFVAAEALANAAKHSHAERVEITAFRRNGVLHLEVVDDGAGGADAEGTGLTGLRRRVEALDGRFDVLSPPGGPTTIAAELPCES
jgi:signal transduction histidine kinase